MKRLKNDLLLFLPSNSIKIYEHELINFQDTTISINGHLMRILLKY